MENIKRLVKDNRQHILHMIPNNYLPILDIRLSGLTLNQFEEKDLEDVFTVFGDLHKIDVEHDHASVHFKDLAAAFFAQKTLHKKYISTLKTSISLTWRKTETRALSVRV